MTGALAGGPGGASVRSSSGGLFRVALTFDAELPDRPNQPGVTARILDALGDEGVAATFFVQGRWAEAEPALVARIAADGHLVGNHSYAHARLPSLTAGTLVRDVRDAEAAILAAGVDPRPWFRCPYGSGAGNARIVARLATLGYVDVSWHVDSRDWAGGTAAALESRLVPDLTRHGDGAVALLHGWPPATAVALPAIVRRLRQAGATFVRVDALDVVPGRRAVPAS